MLRKGLSVVVICLLVGPMHAQLGNRGGPFVLELVSLWPTFENAQTLVAAVDQGNETVQYQVRFETTWSAVTHPDQFPPNPHFSGLIGGTHHGPTTFWLGGEPASPGIRNMAETGSKFPLDDEINIAITQGKAGFLLSGGGIGLSPGSVDLVFQINRRFPRVSLVTMIAPSPDWFVGVSSLLLYDENGWVDEVVVSLFPYDAGTDSGANYLSPDEPTIPVVSIFAMTGPPFLNGLTLMPLGQFTFTRLNP